MKEYTNPRINQISLLLSWCTHNFIIGLISIWNERLCIPVIDKLASSNNSKNLISYFETNDTSAFNKTKYLLCYLGVSFVVVPYLVCYVWCRAVFSMLCLVSCPVFMHQLSRSYGSVLLPHKKKK